MSALCRRAQGLHTAPAEVIERGERDFSVDKTVLSWKKMSIDKQTSKYEISEQREE